MAPTCDYGSIPRQCAEKFEEISHSLGQIKLVAEDVRALRRAIIGNGRPDGSLAFRLRRLEQLRTDSRSALRRWIDRLWKLAVAAALVVLGWWLKAN